MREKIFQPLHGLFKTARNRFNVMLLLFGVFLTYCIIIIPACNKRGPDKSVNEISPEKGLNPSESDIQNENTGTKKEPDAQAVSKSGMIVVVDPETGELKAPTAEEINEISAKAELDQSPEGLTSKTLPDGTEMINLQGGFMNYSVTGTAKDNTQDANSE